MPPGKRRKNYSQEDVESTVKAVKEGGLSIRRASEDYGFPKSTILDNLKDGHGTAMGRPTVLSEEEETQLLERVQVGNFLTQQQQVGTGTIRYGT
jgi:transposase